MTGFAPWTPRPRRRSIRTTPGAYAGTSRSSTPRERPPARCSPAASTARRGSGACSSRCARIARLEPALRRRVDGMVAAGLVRELERAAATTAAEGARGAGQAIGFHEWGAYLRARVRLGRRDGRRLVKGTRAPPRAALALNEERNKEVGTAASGAGASRPSAAARGSGARPSTSTRSPRRRRGDQGGHVSPGAAPGAPVRAAGARVRVAAEVPRFDRDAPRAPRERRAAAAAAGRWTCSTPRAPPPRASCRREREGSSAPGVSGGDDAKRRRGDASVCRAAENAASPWREYRCDVCDRTVRGEAERRAHFQGRRHLKRVAAARETREGARARAGFGGDAPDGPSRRIEPGIA